MDLHLLGAQIFIQTPSFHVLIHVPLNSEKLQ
jgi:hypothetical protein